MAKKLFLNKGWNLVGNIPNIDAVKNDSISYVWKYAGGQWQDYKPTNNSGIMTEIDNYDGVWIKADSDLILSLPDEKTLEADIQTTSCDINQDDIKEGFVPGIPTLELPVFSRAFTNEKFNSLKENQKYKVIDKIASAFFIGFTKFETEDIIKKEKPITYLRNLLLVSKSAEFTQATEDIQRFNYSWNHRKIPEQSFAMFLHLKPSKEYLDYWTTYMLMNSKFFSASLDLNTVEMSTGGNLLGGLYEQLKNGYTMESILYKYLLSEEFWRRFRSPEDNTREALELIVEIFDDSLVPLASQSAMDYSYNEREKNLYIDPYNKNTEVLNILGEKIIDVKDFYKKCIVNDPKREKVFIKYWLDFYFPLWDNIKKENFTNDLLDVNADRYQDILLNIIFSEDFINESVRMKKFEEIYLGVAKKTSFNPAKNTFQNWYKWAYNSNQAPMGHKLGREIIAPDDTLSFCQIFKTIRESFFLDRSADVLNDWDAGWTTTFFQSLNFTTNKTLIKDVFLFLLSREATSSEISILIEINADYKLSSNNDKVKILTNILDYISRLTEIYVSQKI